MPWTKLPPIPTSGIRTACLASLHAALVRVERQIVAATCSVAIGDLLRVRASIREQIKQKGDR